MLTTPASAFIDIVFDRHRAVYAGTDFDDETAPSAFSSGCPSDAATG